MPSTTTISSSEKEQAITQAVGATITHLKDEPTDGAAQFTVRASLKEAFKASISARNHTLITDEPEDLGGDNAGPNPVEYLLAALAGCQELLVKAHATQLGIAVQAVDVKVKGDIDLKGFFGVSDGRPGFNHIEYETTVTTNETDSEKLAQLKQISLNNCPVLDNLKAPTDVEGQLHFVTGS